MIAEPRRTGMLGELKAARYLREKGYDIYAANYKTKSGEIDLIAEKNETLCFVEVKTRRDGGLFPPSDAVDYKKEENVKNTAAAYLAASKMNMNFRFDIIEVILCDGKYRIRHIKNAF